MEKTLIFLSNLINNASNTQIALVVGICLLFLFLVYRVFSYAGVFSLLLIYMLAYILLSNTEIINFLINLI